MEVKKLLKALTKLKESKKIKDKNKEILEFMLILKYFMED